MLHPPPPCTDSSKGAYGAYWARMTSLTIRPAQVFDAAFAAPLIQDTIGKIGLELTGTRDDTDAAHVIAEFFALRGNRLSFTHTLIAEREGRPLGLAVAYPGDLAHALDEPFRAHRDSLGLPPGVDSEGVPGELYLDTLAVTEAARGQGLGGQLLEAAAERARATGLPRVGLLVEDGNPAARLYARQGFRVTGWRDLAGSRYAHMTLDVTR